MKKVTPDISINLCYRSIKISEIYSHTFKPIRDKFNINNCVYKFACVCSSTYIGQSKRKLKKRSEEHNQPSKSLGVVEHIQSCEFYKTRKKAFMEDFKNLPKPLKLTELQKENEFYKSHFSILQKNFRNVFERLRSEAYYIRMFRPKLNIQTNTQKYFQLFWIRASLFLNFICPKLQHFEKILDLRRTWLYVFSVLKTLYVKICLRMLFNWRKR